MKNTKVRVSDSGVSFSIMVFGVRFLINKHGVTASKTKNGMSMRRKIIDFKKKKR